MSLSKAQIELRRTGITATDVSAIVGMNPYRSQGDVLAEKLYPELSTFAGNRRTRWGNLAERVLLDDYAESNGYKLVFPGTLRHADEVWCLASPDAVVVDENQGRFLWCVEAKTVGARSAWRWGEEGGDDIPSEYLVQGAWQMFVCNVDKVEFPVVVDNEQRLYVLHRDAELEDSLVASAHAWYQRHLVERQPLEPDGSDGFRELLLRRYPHHAETVVQADETVEELATSYRSARTELEAAEAKATRLKQAIMSAIGPHAALEGSFGRITWRKTADVERLDYKAALDEALEHVPLPLVSEIKKQFTRTAPGTRRFCVPRSWGGESK